MFSTGICSEIIAYRVRKRPCEKKGFSVLIEAPDVVSSLISMDFGLKKARKDFQPSHNYQAPGDFRKRGKGRVDRQEKFRYALRLVGREITRRAKIGIQEKQE
jgi:hypothetical protein